MQPAAVTIWPERPNPTAHTVEVLFEAPDGRLVGFDLVVVPMPSQTWAAWLTTDGELVRMALVGSCQPRAKGHVVHGEPPFRSPWVEKWAGFALSEYFDTVGV